MNDYVGVSVKVPVEDAAALREIAEREDRTVAALLRRMIRRHVELDRLERAA